MWPSICNKYVIINLQPLLLTEKVFVWSGYDGVILQFEFLDVFVKTLLSKSKVSKLHSLLLKIWNCFLELYCPVLEKPFYGAVTPATCVTRFENIRIGTVCSFNCTKGYEIKSRVDNKYLSCRIDGTWDQDTPSCYRKYYLGDRNLLKINSKQLASDVFKV